MQHKPIHSNGSCNGGSGCLRGICCDRHFLKLACALCCKRCCMCSERRLCWVGCSGMSPTCQSISIDTTSTQQDLRSARRSEEHTSELQSLMRISYAVFCL